MFVNKGQGNLQIISKSLIIATMHFGTTFINDLVIFRMQNTIESGYTTSLYIVGKIVVYILLCACWYKFLQLNFRDPIDYGKTKLFLIYFLIMFLLLMIEWPGVWRFDEMITLGALTNGAVIYYWQHWLSSLYQFVCMQIIPFPGGIIIIQIFLISLIITHIVWKLHSYLHTKWAYLIYCIFLLPAVLDSNLFPIRATPCAYLELLFVFNIIEYVFLEKKIIIKDIIFLSLLGGLVTAWRPENIIYVAGFPILLALAKKIRVKLIAIYLFISILLVAGCNHIQNVGLGQIIFAVDEAGEITTEKEAYSLSGFITGLGQIVSTDFKSNTKEADLKLIDETMNLEMLQQTDGMTVFWNQELKGISSSKLSKLKKLYVKLVLYNLPVFLAKRWDLFMKSTHVFEGSAYIYDDVFNMERINLNTGNIGTYQEFGERYLLNHPISVELRKKMILLLECYKDGDFDTIIHSALYSVLPIIIILLIICLYELIHRDYRWFFCIGLILAKAGIVFLTAPMEAFMYYFSTYLVGGALIMIWLISKIKTYKRFHINRKLQNKII